MARWAARGGVLGRVNRSSIDAPCVLAPHSPIAPPERSSFCESFLAARLSLVALPCNPPRMRLLVLARHGRSLRNVEGVVNGDPTLDHGLSPDGTTEAAALGPQLA